MPQKSVASRIADVVNECLKLAGLTMSKLPERGSLERELRDMLGKFAVDCVIDVGAHHGEFADTLRKCGFGGRIISFEPSEESFQITSEASRNDDLWTVHRMCLGDEDGEVELQRFQSTDFNSLHAPSASALAGRWGESMQASGTERVPIRRLDTVMAELGVSCSSVCLKIDTQGHDLQVAAGATETLKQTRVILTELSVVRLYEGAPTLEESVGFFRQRSYLPVGFYPVVRDRDGITVFEFDCFFIKSDAAAAHTVSGQAA